MAYNSLYVARIIRTDKLIFTASTHDPQSLTDGWYSTDDGTSRDCALVMDNETFLRMLKNGEVEYVQVPVDRRAYGFEIKKNFYKEAREKVLSNIQRQMF